MGLIEIDKPLGGHADKLAACSSSTVSGCRLSPIRLEKIPKSDQPATAAQAAPAEEAEKPGKGVEAMRGWKIALLAVMGGLGVTLVAGGARTMVQEVLGRPWSSGGELVLGLGAMLLVGAGLLYGRWRAP